LIRSPLNFPLVMKQKVFRRGGLDLGEGHRLLLHGRIDRIDLCRGTDSDEASCVVVDYKSSQKQLDPLLMEHNLQLQLAAYLNVLRRWPNPRPQFGVARLIPAGVFYVNCGEDTIAAKIATRRWRALKPRACWLIDILDDLTRIVPSQARFAVRGEKGRPV